MSTDTGTTHGALEGVGASGGVVVGPPVHVRRDDRPTAGATRDLDAAVAHVVAHYADLERRDREAGRDEEADVLGAYQLLAADPELVGAVRSAAADAPLDTAVRTAGEALAAELAELGDAYLAQRAEDLLAVVTDLVASVRGRELAVVTDLPEGAVVIAAELSPADTSQLDLDRVAGFAIEGGGMTSHTAIIARSHAIPAVVGCAGIVAATRDATNVLLDGDAGAVHVDPDRDTVAAGHQRAEARRLRREHAARMKGRPVSLAGRRILVGANVGTGQQLAAAVAAAADGIGLYRTEFLHLGASHPPTREEQAHAYRAAVEAFDDPVVVRLLDIGGDKEAPWLDSPDEDNPFLGVRGVRLLLRHPELLERQLDALLDASGVGDLRVMVPMVAAVADLLAVRTVLDERAAAAGKAPPPLGVMVETPAAALLAPHLARHAAFFSIGTNDLTQYTAAADRGEAALRRYHDPVAPPVLQLVQHTVDAGRAAGIPVGVCGAAASDPVAAAVLLGMGVDELSVPPGEVDPVRALVDELDAEQVTALARDVLELPDADAVRAEAHERLGGVLW